MKAIQMGIFAILTIGIIASILGTTSLSLTTPAFATGDEKKCKDNGNNNCNDTHKTQTIKARNECDIENTNKDDSSHNDNENKITCVNEAQNLKDVDQIFGVTDEPVTVIDEPVTVIDEPATVTEEAVE